MNHGSSLIRLIAGAAARLIRKCLPRRIVSLSGRFYLTLDSTVYAIICFEMNQFSGSVPTGFPGLTGWSFCLIHLLADSADPGISPALISTVLTATMANAGASLHPLKRNPPIIAPIKEI